MKVLGALESAQIEWFTNAGKPAASSYPYRVIYVTDLKQIQVSDGTNWNPSAIRTYTAATLPAAGASNTNQLAFITDTLQVKVSDGTQWKTIGARLDTYTSGTIPAAASNSNSIIWVSDLQQVQVSNGSAWIQVGSKAGTKNYFSQNNANSDFETNSVSPWSACTLTFSSGVPSGAPTLTATQMTISTSATNPLSGTYSMLLTKAAANAQYQGFISGALTIDREDTAKVLYGSFYYEVTSGTVDFSGSSTQTYEIWIYNTVSGTWTQPAGYRGMNQSSGVGQVVFSFQTDGTYANNSYKIAVITQQTGTGAITVKFDDFSVGPESIVLGAPMTDWQSYTPTFTGFGTATNVEFQYRRVGDSVQVRGKFNPGTGTAVEARISLPAGLTSADTTKIPSIQIAGAWARATFASTINNWVILSEPSVTYITLGQGDTSSAGALTKLQGSVFSTSAHSLTFQVPIQGWSSNVQISSDTDTRVVAAIFYGNAGTSVTANTTNIPFTVQDKDTHAAWNGSTFLAPISGFYQVFGSINVTPSDTAQVSIYIDGTQKFRMFNNSTSATTIKPFAGMVYLNAGQSMSIRTTGTTTIVNTPEYHWISICRVSGPSVITATETVACEYTSTAGNTLTNTTNLYVDFPTKQGDTHNAVAGAGSGNNATATSTWRFVAPVSGRYCVSYAVSFTTPSTTNLDYVGQIHVNGAGQRQTVRNNFATVNTGGATISGSGNVQLNAGDYVSIRVYQSSSANRTMTTNANENWVTIVRVGN